MKQRILIVEDDAALARILRDNFTSDGYEVQCVADGNVAVGKANEFAPDLILLDVMLPGKSGIDVCTVLRGRRQTPVIMLSAKSARRDKLRGLDSGADDYITKPFDLEELLARVRAVLRRAHPTVERLTLGTVTINLHGLQAWDGDTAVDFSHREFELLREIWGYVEAPNTRSVDHAIARLRRKIEPDVHHPRFIHTVHGDGYCLTPD